MWQLLQGEHRTTALASFKAVSKTPSRTCEEEWEGRHVGSTPCLLSYWGKLWLREGPCLTKGKAPGKRNLSWLHKQVRTPGMNHAWVGLVDSHMEAELQM